MPFRNLDPLHLLIVALRFLLNVPQISWEGYVMILSLIIKLPYKKEMYC